MHFIMFSVWECNHYIILFLLVRIAGDQVTADQACLLYTPGGECVPWSWSRWSGLVYLKWLLDGFSTKLCFVFHGHDGLVLSSSDKYTWRGYLTGVVLISAWQSPGRKSGEGRLGMACVSYHNAFNIILHKSSFHFLLITLLPCIVFAMDNVQML